MFKKKNSHKINDFIDSVNLETVLSIKTYLPLYLLIGLVFSVLFVNLYNMQLVKGDDYLSASNLNYKNRNTLRAPRGLIFDQNGTSLAFNQNKYSVFVDPLEFDEENTIQLAGILNLTEKEINEKINNETVFGRATLRQDLSHDEYLNVAGKIKDIAGVYTDISLGRVYSDPYLYSHIIGYIGDPQEEDITDRVDAHSQIGKTGLEKQFDTDLRGYDGVEVEETDITSGEKHNYIPRSAEPGNNLVLTLDDRWQRLAYEALKDKVNATRGLGGSFIIMDIETGELKTLASFPTINIEEFSNGISQENYQKLLDDPSSPLLDRSIGVALPTGSIFKIITGAIALQVGVIDQETIFYSDGCMTLPGEQEFCESFFRKLGQVDIFRAIKLSSNIYFCNVALNFEKDFGGIDIFKNYAEEFGIGEYTGIDIPGEASGVMPSPDLKSRLLAEPWYSGDLCNTAIGQGLLSATPLQMVIATAAFENGGKILKPQIIDKVVDVNGNTIRETTPEVKKELSISQENLDIIKESMVKAVRDPDGTVRKLSSYEDYISGKTGTATAPVRINGILYNEPHAWVVGVFEWNGRKYAYSVNIAHGGWGEETVDVVKKFLEGI